MNHNLGAFILEDLPLQGAPLEQQLLHVLNEAGLQPIPEGAAFDAAAQPLSGLAHAAGGGERDVGSQVRDSGGAANPLGQQHLEPASAPLSEEEVEQEDTGDENEAAEPAEPGNEHDTGSSGKPARGVKRKKGGRSNVQGMQGRFSGRLETKEDEKRLAEECRLLGPYLSGGPPGDKSMQTLAKIVRGIASGEVRRHVEAQDRELQELRCRLGIIPAVPDSALVLQLQEEAAALREQLAMREARIAALERDLADANSRLQTVAAAAAGQPPPRQVAALERDLAEANARLQSVAAAAAGQQPQHTLVPPATANGVQLAAAPPTAALQPAAVPVSMQLGGGGGEPQLQVPLVISQPAPQLPLGGVPPIPTLLSQPAPAQQQQQQQQLPASHGTVLASVQLRQASGGAHAAAQQVLQVGGQQQATAVAALGQASMHQHAAAGLVGALPDATGLAQPTGRTLSGGGGQQQQLLASGSGTGIQLVLQPAASLAPAGTTLSGQQVVSVVTQPTLAAVQQPLAALPVATQTLSGDAAKPLILADAGIAAPAASAAQQDTSTVIQDTVQHLAVQATLHGQAKSQAETQAQQLAQQANLHAQASVQAAVQAEQLKKTLAVLPESDQKAAQAVATVESLEARAQAHAEITAQAVAQAREMQEQAQAHAQKEAKAIAQATMLQAQTLQVVDPQALQPAATLSSGADPPALLPVVATRSGGGGAASVSLGHSDVVMAQELGLLPTSPLSAGGGAVTNTGASLLHTDSGAGAAAPQPQLMPPTSAAVPVLPAILIQHQMPQGVQQVLPQAVSAQPNGAGGVNLQPTMLALPQQGGLQVMAQQPQLLQPQQAQQQQQLQQQLLVLEHAQQQQQATVTAASSVAQGQLAVAAQAQQQQQQLLQEQQLLQVHQQQQLLQAQQQQQQQQAQLLPQQPQQQAPQQLLQPQQQVQQHAQQQAQAILQPQQQAQQQAPLLHAQGSGVQSVGSLSHSMGPSQAHLQPAMMQPGEQLLQPSSAVGQLMPGQQQNQQGQQAQLLAGGTMAAVSQPMLVQGSTDMAQGVTDAAAHMQQQQQQQQQQPATTQQLQQQLLVLEHAQHHHQATATVASSVAQGQLAVAAQAQQQQQQMAVAAAALRAEIAAIQHHQQGGGQPAESAVHAMHAPGVLQGQGGPVMVMQPSGDLTQSSISAAPSALSGGAQGVATLPRPQAHQAVPMEQQPNVNYMMAGMPAMGQHSLDLPPGVEAMMQSLPVDPASLSAAAAMAPVVSIPGEVPNTSHGH